MVKPKCPVCGSHKAKLIARFPQVPVLCNSLLATADAARNARKGDITLSMCLDCAMVWNQSFDESLLEYSSDYENALHYSNSFQEYARSLVADLVHRHNLKGEAVFEIGCGDGYMLNAFLAQGIDKAIGFDPSMAHRSRHFSDDERLQIIAETFDAKHTPYDCKLVVCRHVLEHIDDPKSFLRDVLASLPTSNVPLYFEVPNANWLLSEPSPWDVIYEHVGYWTKPSLTKLFQDAGCTVTKCSTAYKSQFLQVEAVRAPSASGADEAVQDIIAAGNTFSVSTENTFKQWNHILQHADTKIVVWGAGSKGITFANFAQNNGHAIEALVDLNPIKHGLFAPGAATRVIAPSALSDLQPDLVVIANGLYRAEIEHQLASMGIAASTKTLL